MNLVFDKLKKIFPELNKQVITVSRILEAFEAHNVTVAQLPLDNNGYYVSNAGKEFVFVKYALNHYLLHETLSHEASHVFGSSPECAFLLRRFEIEAETLSLIMMMPLSDLPRLNRIKHQLDAESFDLLKRRNKINEIWQL